MFHSFWMIGPKVKPLGSPFRVDCEYSAKNPRLKKYFPGSVSWNVFYIVVAVHDRCWPPPAASSPSSSTSHHGVTPYPMALV